MKVFDATDVVLLKEERISQALLNGQTLGRFMRRSGGVVSHLALAQMKQTLGCSLLESIQNGLNRKEKESLGDLPWARRGTESCSLAK